MIWLCEYSLLLILFLILSKICHIDDYCEWLIFHITPQHEIMNTTTSSYVTNGVKHKLNVYIGIIFTKYTKNEKTIWRRLHIVPLKSMILWHFNLSHAPVSHSTLWQGYEILNWHFNFQPNTSIILNHIFINEKRKR